MSISSCLIKVHRVSKRYVHGQNTTIALDEVSFEVAEGDVYGIIGLSGAGKSTLIRCLAGLITPTSGEIVFQGEDVATMKKKALRRFRRKVGMIFQHFNLLSSRTAAGNIAYPLEIAGVDAQEIEKTVDELLHLVGLAHKKDVYPIHLSGGEKQRIGIARALAHRPTVLLCDEATSALDPKTTREVLSLLKNLRKKMGITIVVITHEMTVVKQICTKVAVMEHGKIIEQGSVSSIFSDPQHITTKQLLEHTSHEIPPEFIQKALPHRKLLRLRFKGKAAGEPLVSELVQKFHVHANILLGWIDRLDKVSVGTLIIELTGSPEGVAGALDYLTKHEVHYEVITDE